MVYKWELQIPTLSPELTRRAYLYLPPVTTSSRRRVSR